jgi:hypothetical protein
VVTAEVPIVAAGALTWAEFHESVNAWRGRCLNAFGRAEHAVSEALDRLSRDAERGHLVKLPHLVGQRFEALAAAIGEGGPFEKDSASALKALNIFRAHDALRAPLCHGLGKITVDQSSRWTVVVRMTSFRGRRIEHLTYVWEEEEAKRLADRVHADAQRLHARLAPILSS